MNNIIECKLESTYKEIYTGLWQYDYGQRLRITGVDLPTAVEVQFSSNEKSGNTITRIGTTVDGVTEVQIPDELLRNEGYSQNYKIYAYIYLTDETSGNTEYQIVLYVKARAKPENPSEEPPTEQNIFHEAIATINESTDRAQAAAARAENALAEVKKVGDGLSDHIEQAKELDGTLAEKIEQGRDIAASIGDKFNFYVLESDPETHTEDFKMFYTNLPNTTACAVMIKAGWVCLLIGFKADMEYGQFFRIQYGTEPTVYCDVIDGEFNFA